MDLRSRVAGIISRMGRSFFSLSGLGSFVMALVLAIMVWMAATIQANPFTEGYLAERVPVEVVNRGEGLVVVGGVGQEVRIRVRAPESVWEDLTADDFRAYVDLQGLGVGLHEVAVRVEPAGNLVRILQVSPSALAIRLDNVAQKSVPVTIDVLGNPPLGYSVRPVQVAPTQISVRGPQSLVDQVQQANGEVFLSGQKETFDRSVTIVPKDEVGNTLEGLELDQRTARVTVPIEQEVGYRELSVKPTVEGSPAPGYWVSSISATPSTVTVSGDPEAVNQIPGYVETFPVNVEDARADISQRVPLVFPEGVTPLEDAATAQALIEISPVLGGQTVQLTPVVRGLGRGLEATFSPETVEVILSGPLSELEALEAGDVEVVLNLSDYEPGTHLVTPEIRRPDSLEVQAVLPDQVEVVIQES
jgi:YbbR domain-containing protein